MDAQSSLFKRTYHVELRDVDFTKQLRISTLFSLFQEIASLASEELGFGIETIEKKFGVAWILTRIRVDILRRPQWDEEVTIETWPLEPGKIEFDRDFLVRDTEGHILIRATSKWVIMDVKNRKIKRGDMIGIRYPEKRTERAIAEKLGKLKSSGKLEPVYNKVIGYSDIDFNGHLNNARYIDYIMDCFNLEDHTDHPIQSIDLNFHQEALPGDTLTLYQDHSRLDEKVLYIEGINQTDNHMVFQSLLKIH
ncbi:acyl-ACP thioesterase [Pullulanibacillus camelliae]|uniref:Acyl-ACP thioesterase n=1 Tax=Pullulanibacillus camelliae TaxID=1707096 RepID=A0A8J2VL27_9BACL|nr:acyl-ACP thioesterase domain-containing protein [Pullulanibacillus camelliae]GGE35172.1 acyl-ACP thioesterase [Pullulanibacillus camelliae]